MSVTVKDICSQFDVSRQSVQQVGSKQLFIVKTDTKKLLVSYRTIVGLFIENKWHITKEKYSVTTSKQINYFIRHYTKHEVIRVAYIAHLSNSGSNHETT